MHREILAILLADRFGYAEVASSVTYRHLFLVLKFFNFNPYQNFHFDKCFGLELNEFY